MSEKKPEPKDRSAITTALIGAGAVVVTAVISSIIAPIILRGFESSPTPIVIPVTPPPTAISQATSIPPTGISQPSATIQPTLTLSPTIELRAASATPVPPSPTPSNIVTLVLVNNLPNAMEFFVDGVSVTSIDSGAYQVIPIARGRRELKQCVFGSDTTDPNNCLAKSAVFPNAVDHWEMFETNSSIPPQAKLTLLVLNQSALPQDIYMDGIFAKTVQGNAFIELNGPGGLHTLQPCAVGETPASDKCGERNPLQLSKRVEIFTILGNAP